jgi:hypothetical protein
MKKNILQLTLLAIGALLPIGLQAQILIDVQFGGNTFNPSPDAALQTGAAATGSSGDQWNYVNAPARLVYGTLTYTGLTTTGLDLKDTTGASSGVTLKGNGSIVGAFSATPGKLTANLSEGYIVPVGAGGSYTFTFSGLKGGSDYDLYVYSVPDTSRQATFSIDGKNFKQVGPNSGTAFNDPANYTILSGVADGTGDFTLTADASSDAELDINGFQLSAITASAPEPSTYVLMLGGIAFLILVVRRRTRLI